MSRFYLAARYGRRLEMVEHAADLTRLGHEVVSTWVDGHHEVNSKHGARADQEASNTDKAAWATEDFIDLLRADCLIAFTEELGVEGCERGGCHVELGMALAWHKTVIVVGPRENIFCCWTGVWWVNTWAGCLQLVGAAALASGDGGE